MKRFAFLLTIGLGGAAILMSLGVWQVQRLAWKEGILQEIDARISDAPVALPSAPDPTTDAYLPVEVAGTLRAEYLRVLVSKKQVGAGYRIIRPMIHPEGDILIDLGFVPVSQTQQLRFEEGPVTRVIGNLQWPQETDSYTPEPDLTDNIWFARDVQAMAKALDTRPVLVVRRDAPQSGGPVTPMPVDTAAIPNDHLQYAITWFSLAAIWLLMTLYFLRRGAAAKQN